MSLPKLAAIGIVLLMSGCAQRTEPVYQEPEPVPALPDELVDPLPTGPVKVALLLPLSGNAAAVGRDMLEAAQMALFDVGRTDMVLLPRDTGGTPAGAAAAARSAIDAGAELILGPLFARAAGAVAPVAAEHDLTVISFSNDASVAGGNVWVLGFRPEEQVARVIEYARSRGMTRIGTLAPDDAYGRRAVNGFRDAMGSAPAAARASTAEDSVAQDSAAQDLAAQELPAADGAADGQTFDNQASDNQASDSGVAARLVGEASAGGTGHAFYPPDEAELARVVREFTGYREPPEGSIGVSGNTRTFDALLLADGGDRLRSVAALLAFYDVDLESTRLLGTMLWEDDPRLLFEETLQGGWYASVSPENERRFQGRFERTFGREPVALAGLAYDATALAAVVGNTDRSFPTARLTDSSGFVGRAGIFRLRSDGTTQHGLAIVEIDNGTARVVDPAPRSFLVAFLDG